MAARQFDHLQTACMKLVGDGKDPYLGCTSPGQIDERDQCLTGLVSQRLLSQVGDGYQLTRAGRTVLLPASLQGGILETEVTEEGEESYD